MKEMDIEYKVVLGDTEKQVSWAVNQMLTETGSPRWYVQGELHYRITAGKAGAGFWYQVMVLRVDRELEEIK